MFLFTVEKTTTLRHLRVQGSLSASVVVLGDRVRIRRRVTRVSGICFRYVRIERRALPTIHFGARTDRRKACCTAACKDIRTSLSWRSCCRSRISVGARYQLMKIIGIDCTSRERQYAERDGSGNLETSHVPSPVCGVFPSDGVNTVNPSNEPAVTTHNGVTSASGMRCMEQQALKTQTSAAIPNTGT